MQTPPVPQTLLIMAPQVSPVGQVAPQLMVPPHVSVAMPQSKPCWAQVLGVQVTPPQTLAVPPPPQVSLPLQVPQSRMLPQPSAALPQSSFCCMQSPL